MLNQIIYFILSCLPVVVGFKLYDVYRTRWQWTGAGKRKERYSKLWHAFGFWTVLITVVIISFHYFTLKQITDFGPWLSVIVWIIYDVAWNLFNDEDVFYPGNGGGSFLEIIFKWMGDHIGWDASFWLMMTKILLFIGSSVWAFRYNL